MIKRKGAGKAARSAASAARLPAADPALEVVRELARIATEFDLSEVEYDPSGKVRVSRRLTAAVAAPSAPPAPSSAPVLAVVPAAAPAEDENTVYVSSPFVGTFYRAPSPESPSFVEVGQAVRKGQVVCILEAMKLMNEIESEADGTVAEILVKNGEHVEYGQKLIRLSRS